MLLTTAHRPIPRELLRFLPPPPRPAAFLLGGVVEPVRRRPFFRTDDERQDWLLRSLPPHFTTTTFTPTVPTFSTPVTATSYATSSTPNTTVTLDLTAKFGAWLHCRIGRNAATALTRYAYFAVRRQVNNTLVHPANNYDFTSSTAAVNATTVSSGGASGATTMVLASGTGYAANQMVMAQLAAARCEWFEINDLTTATITIDRSGGFRTTHNASDTVTNGADVGSIWIPGGDIWEFTPNNNSGQTVIMAMDAAVYASDTGT